MISKVAPIFKILVFFLITSCANIIPPSGGPKDKLPPQILKISHFISEEKLIGSKLVYEFHEKIAINDIKQNFYISPPLKNMFFKTQKNVLSITINDTLLENTLYSINMDNFIKDITENNVLESFEDTLIKYTLSPSTLKFYSLKVRVRDSYTVKNQENHWVLLYESTTHDSLIFKISPNYISKSNSDGIATFNNLINGDYKILSISGKDLFYSPNERISFHKKTISAGIDTSINLFAFNPLEVKNDSLTIQDSLSQMGSLYITCDLINNLMVELSKGEKIFLRESFENNHYIELTNIPQGDYTLKLFVDINNNKKWDTGNFEKERQPEKVFIYPEKIIIKENDQLNIVWNLFE